MSEQQNNYYNVGEIAVIDYIKVGMYDSDNLNKENKKDPLTNVILASNNQYFIAGRNKEK